MKNNIFSQTKVIQLHSSPIQPTNKSGFIKLSKFGTLKSSLAQTYKTFLTYDWLNQTMKTAMAEFKNSRDLLVDFYSNKQILLSPTKSGSKVVY